MVTARPFEEPSMAMPPPTTQRSQKSRFDGCEDAQKSYKNARERIIEIFTSLKNFRIRFDSWSEKQKREASAGVDGK